MIPISQIPALVPEYGKRARYSEMPDELSIRLGVVPLDKLPASWWNAMWCSTNTAVNCARSSLNILVSEIDTVLSQAGITPDGGLIDQLYRAIDTLRQTVGTALIAGAVKSSSCAGQVSINNNGVMTVNCVGNATQLATATPTIVGGINTLRSTYNSCFNTLPSTLNGCASTMAPKNHACCANTYGVGTSSNYGHLKITDVYNASSTDTAISQKTVATAYCILHDIDTAASTCITNLGNATDLTTTATTIVGAINEVRCTDLIGGFGTLDTCEGTLQTGFTNVQTGAATTLSTANTCDNAMAPKAHATTGTTYGVGTSSSYGHLKLSDQYRSVLSACNGVAASQKGLATMYSGIGTYYGNAIVQRACTARIDSRSMCFGLSFLLAPVGSAGTFSCIYTSPNLVSQKIGSGISQHFIDVSNIHTIGYLSSSNTLIRNCSEPLNAWPWSYMTCDCADTSIASYAHSVWNCTCICTSTRRGHTECTYITCVSIPSDIIGRGYNGTPLMMIPAEFYSSACQTICEGVTICCRSGRLSISPYSNDWYPFVCESYWCCLPPVYCISQGTPNPVVCDMSSLRLYKAPHGVIISLLSNFQQSPSCYSLMCFCGNEDYRDGCTEVGSCCVYNTLSRAYPFQNYYYDTFTSAGASCGCTKGYTAPHLYLNSQNRSKRCCDQGFYSLGLLLPQVLLTSQVSDNLYKDINSSNLVARIAACTSSNIDISGYTGGTARERLEFYGIPIYSNAVFFKE